MNVAIIGGGMTGLSIAYYLSKNGIRCCVYEASPALGGLAGSSRYEDMVIDKFYHHFYLHDDALINLIGEIGLQDTLIWKATQTGMYYNGKVHPLSTPVDLLKFSPLALTDRLRMGILVFRSQRKKDFSFLETISAKDWIVDKCGKNVYQIMWEPLLRSKFGVYAENISAAWLFSKFTKRGASRTKHGAEKLGYLKGGLARLILALRDQISKTSETHTSMPVKKIITEQGKAKGLVFENGKRENCDIIISTLSTETTSNLLEDSQKEYKKTLSRIRYLANITLVLFLTKSLSRYYWLNINDPECPFVGVIEHTALAGTEEYKGNHLVYISKYLSKEDKYFSMGKDAILENYLPWLSKINPEFNKEYIKTSLLSRETYTQPVIGIGYRDILPSVNTPIENFYLVTMAQIFPEDRQVSNSIRDGKVFALRLLSEMKK